MSSKSTIFLTEDNEHCYTDCNDPITKDGKWIGDVLTIEIDGANINSKTTDLSDGSLVIELDNPESEIYKLIMSLKK